MTAELPPTIYGVWIRGEGWLKHGARPLAFLDKNLADTAARMLLPKAARTELVDDSMFDLEAEFLKQEADRLDRERRARFVYRLQVWWRALWHIGTR